MNGIVRVQLGGQERVLRFNMFSLTEMHKSLFDTPVSSMDIGKIMEEVLDISKSNEFLFTKLLVYTGILGNDYVVGFKKTVTPEQVAEWLMTPGEYNLQGLWDAFFESVGGGLEPEKEKDGDSKPAAKKKHQSPTKKRYQKPSES